MEPQQHTDYKHENWFQFSWYFIGKMRTRNRRVLSRVLCNSDMITWICMYLSFRKLSLLKSPEVSVEANPAGNFFFLMHLSIKSKSFIKDESLWKFLYGKVSRKKQKTTFFFSLVFYIARGYGVRPPMHLKAVWYVEFQREGTQDWQFCCKDQFFLYDFTMEMRLLK